MYIWNKSFLEKYDNFIFFLAKFSRLVVILYVRNIKSRFCFCSPGSVVFDFRIYMTSSSYPSGGSQATITISVVRGVLVQVVQNAKANGTQTLMLGTDETKIVVNTGKGLKICLQNCKISISMVKSRQDVKQS